MKVERLKDMEERKINFNKYLIRVPERKVKNCREAKFKKAKDQ